MNAIISLMMGPIGKLALVLVVAAAAWLHGNQSGKESEAEKWAESNAEATSRMIARYESEMSSMIRIMDKDRKLAEQFAKERDDARAESMKLGVKLKDALDKPVYVECKADEDVMNILNKSIGAIK